MKLFILLGALFSFSAQASVSFKCSFPDLTYLNQFALEATHIQVDESDFYNVDFHFLFRAAGRDSQIEERSEARDGFIEIFEAGTLFQQRVYRVVSTIKDAEIEHMNFLIDDVKSARSSHVRLLNGKTFFGQCSSF